MSIMKALKIGDLTAKYPIIQGGMGVGISLHSLAGAVAKAGGIGIISTAQIGFKDPEFLKAPMEANLRAIGEELKKAREIAPKGIIGFNIMVATRNYAQYVKEAVKAGADIIISGAGLPVSLPELVEGAKTKIAPIVSTAKSAMVICKMWDRKYKRIPDLLVIEGPLAGGHLGFSREDLSRYGADTKDVPHTYHQDLYDEEIRGIMKVVKQFEEKYQKHIPVAIAGGIYTRADVEHAMELGADAVQVATRFVTTEECDAPESYKQAYINAKASTAPAASGSSGATTVKSISCSFAKATSLSNSITPIFTHSATSAIPALPGAQYIFSTFGLFASFHAIACSLPPPPTIKIFICVFLLTPQTDRYLAGLPLSFFLFYLFIRDQVNGLRKQLPLCLLHNSALQCLRSITLLYFHCFL